MYTYAFFKQYLSCVGIIQSDCCQDEGPVTVICPTAEGPVQGPHSLLEVLSIIDISLTNILLSPTSSVESSALALFISVLIHVLFLPSRQPYKSLE